jgi:DNA-binding NarL/FixJ family response regulator
MSGSLTKIILTPRQRQILDIVVTRGVSNKNIARMLHISESTVKLHMSSILKKFGLRNRTQLALFARDHTQVEPVQSQYAEQMA